MSDETVATPTVTARRNGLGTAALLLGVVGLVLAVLVIFSPLALPLGLLAIILGAFGVGRARRGEADNRGHAFTGIVTGVLAIGIAVAWGFQFVTFFTEHQSDLRHFGTCMRKADNDAQRVDCIRILEEQLDDEPG
jgi:hypothetical protein